MQREASGQMIASCEDILAAETAKTRSRIALVHTIDALGLAEIARAT